MRRLDLLVAKLGVLVSALLLGLRLLASQPFLLMIPLATGTASLVYVVTQDRTRTQLGHVYLSRTVTGYLPAVVFTGLAALAVLVRITGARTWPAYLLAGAIGALILLQILMAQDEQLFPGAVLVQLLVAAVVIRLTALYVTPGFVGVDIWTHIPVFVDGIVAEGSFAPLAESKYSLAPLYHSIAAVASLVFGDSRMGLYLTLGLLIPLSAVFVYATAHLFVATRWALLATALYAFGDQFIRWGMHIIPTSLGLVFFLAALYCMTRLFVVDDAWSSWLLFALSLAVVFTHQVSTVILLTLLGVGTVIAFREQVAERGPTATRSTPVAPLAAIFVSTLSITIISWAQTPWNDGIFLTRMLSTVADAVREAGFLNLASEQSASVTTRQSGPLSAFIPYLELFGFACLLALAVLGGLRMLKWDRSESISLTYILVSATLFVGIFGLSLFGFRALLPGRWMAFMYAPMAIVAAVGFGHVAGNGSRTLLLALVLIVSLGYPGTMVVAEKASLDSPAFDEDLPRFAYTDAEIDAVESLAVVRPPSVDEQIYSDHPYQTILDPIGEFDGRTVAIGRNGAVSPGPILYREYQSTGPVSYDPPPETVGTLEIDATREETVCWRGRNTVFANEEVRLCTPPAVNTAGGST